MVSLGVSGVLTLNYVSMSVFKSMSGVRIIQLLAVCGYWLAFGVHVCHWYLFCFGCSTASWLLQTREPTESVLFFLVQCNMRDCLAFVMLHGVDCVITGSLRHDLTSASSRDGPTPFACVEEYNMSLQMCSFQLSAKHYNLLFQNPMCRSHLQKKKHSVL